MPNWSAQQNRIFEWIGNPTKNEKRNCVVIARAGTGKTTTILEAVNHAPAAERQILLCAFNKIIADELSKRLKNKNAVARTLHSVGNGFVFKTWGKMLIDERRGRRLAERAIAKDTRNPPRDLISFVADLAAKAKGMSPFATVNDVIDIADQFGLIPESEWFEDLPSTQIALQIAAEYVVEAMEMATVKDGSIDFDDMIFLPVRCKWARPKFDMVIVDEAQDMNFSQLALARMVCHRNGRIMVVGDDRQAIYAFRGADSGSIERLREELDAETLPLNITYRCPINVVALAREIVPDYQAAEGAPWGVVRSVGYDTMIEEALPSNFILSRVNAPLAKICLKLLRIGKRAVIRGRDIGKGLTTLIKKMEARDIPDLVSQIRTWERKTIETLSAQGDDVPDSKLEFVTDQANTICELAEGLASVDELLTRLESLFSDNNVANSVVCSSVHKAKGLEAERVFILQTTLRHNGERASIEESNIAYVAITRSKSELVFMKDPV